MGTNHRGGSEEISKYLRSGVADCYEGNEKDTGEASQVMELLKELGRN